MFKRTIRIRRKFSAGSDHNINTIGIEKAIHDYKKNKNSVYFLSGRQDLSDMVTIISGGGKQIRVKPNSELGVITGFDSEYVYLKPKNRYIKDMITKDHEVIFAFDGNFKGDDFVVTEIVLACVTIETPDELEKIKANKDKTLKDILNSDYVSKSKTSFEIDKRESKLYQDNIKKDDEIKEDVIVEEETVSDESHNVNIKSEFIKEGEDE